jgi:hypothetical protein
MSAALIESRARDVTLPEQDERTTAAQAARRTIEARRILMGASSIAKIEPSRYPNGPRLSNRNSSDAEGLLSVPTRV